MFRELLDHISSYLHCINNSFKRNAPACEKPYCGLRGFGGFRLFFGIRIRSGISSVAAADGKVWVQHKRDNLEGFVDRGGMVKLAFFGGLDTFNRVEDPRCAAGSRVQIASLLDLSGMKMRVIQVRGSWKDYVDIHTLVSHGIDIPTALAAAKAIDRNFDPITSVRALQFFGDGTLRRVPAAIQTDLARWAEAVDLNKLPVLTSRPGLSPGGFE